MQSPSGILGPLFGKAGLYYIRRNRAGEMVIVPRYRNDARTPEQLEYRRRLSVMSKLASKIYLFLLYPFRTFYKKDVPLIASFCQYNMQQPFQYLNRWYIQPFPRTWPADSLYIIERDVFTNSIFVRCPYLFYEDVQNGDLVYLVAMYGPEPRVSYITVTVTLPVTRVPFIMCDAPINTPVTGWAFLVRPAGGGLVRVVSQSRVTYWV